MKAVVAAFNQEKALVGSFSVITNLRMELFESLVDTCILLQTARLYGAAPDPELHDPIAGDTKRLLSVASPSGSTQTQTRTIC